MPLPTSVKPSKQLRKHRGDEHETPTRRLQDFNGMEILTSQNSLSANKHTTIKLTNTHGSTIIEKENRPF